MVLSILLFVEINFIENTKIGLADGLLSEEDCKELIEFAWWTFDNGFDFSEFQLDKQSKDDRNVDFHEEYWYAKNSYVDRYPSHYLKIVEKLNQQANIAFKKYLDLSNAPKKIYNESDLTFKVIHRHQKGHTLGIHTDVQDYGFVFYLNEGGHTKDFGGGELYYRDLDLTLPPVRGRLVIQPGDVNHEVLEVLGGNRYSMTNFLMMEG